MPHPLTQNRSDRCAQRALFGVFLAFVIFLTSTTTAAGPDLEDPDVFSKCWDYKINSNLNVGTVADASNAYIVDNENRLQAVDLARGNKIWSTDLGGEVVSNLLVSNDLLFLVTNSASDGSNAAAKSIVRAIRLQTGITAWQEEITSSPVAWLGASSGNIIAVSSDGAVAALTGANGSKVWTTVLKAGISSEPFFRSTGSGGIELATKNNEVLNISGTDGRVQAVWKSKFLPTAVLRDRAGRLLVGDDRGNVISISAKGNRLWSFRNGAQISSVSLHDSEYVAASYDNFVYKLSRGGDVKWKRRLPGRVNERPTIFGDTVVVSIAGTGEVYALDLRNGKILNRIDTGDEASLRVAPTIDSGFTVAGPLSLSYFNIKCPAK